MVLNRFFNYYNAETLYLQVYNALMAMLKSMLFSNTYLTLIQCQNNVKKVVLHGDILKCTSSVMPSHYHCNVRDCCQVTWHSIVFKCKQDRLALPVSNPFKPLKAVCLLTTIKFYLCLGMAFLKVGHSQFSFVPCRTLTARPLQFSAGSSTSL